MGRRDRARATLAGLAAFALAMTACGSSTDTVEDAMSALRENHAADGLAGTNGGDGVVVTANGFAVEDTPPAPTLLVGSRDAEGFETFADAAEGIDLPTDATAMTGSQTKTFTAALILQLDQEGELSIQDTLADPKWADVLGWPNADAITVEMVLAHTSGIPDFTGTPDFQQSMSDPAWSPTPEEMLASAKTADPVFAPGEGWFYSNSNYLILGLIIEAVTDNTYAAELQTRILDPLGLDDTSLYTDDSADPTMPGYVLWCPEDDASGGDDTTTTVDDTTTTAPAPTTTADATTTTDGGGGDGDGDDDDGPPACPTDAEWQAIAPPDNQIWSLIWAAGGVMSTTADMTTWLQELVASDAVLDAEHRELMQTASSQSLDGIGEQFPYLADTFVGYGLGLCLFDYDAGSGFGHLGNTPGYASNSVYFPGDDDPWAVSIVAGENDADVAEDGGNAITTAVSDQRN